MSGRYSTVWCVFCVYQEVEPTVGEALCRLFPPDENIDLRRIAQIARQSLKRRDPSSGGTGKTSSGQSATPPSATASRSAPDVSQPPLQPAGITESSSSRSDMLLLGRPRTLCWTCTQAALGPCDCRTDFTDIRSFCGTERSRLFRMQTGILIPAWHIDIPFSATLSWTVKMDLVGLAGKCQLCMNSKRGGVDDRTVPQFLQDILNFFGQLNGWSKDLLRKILRRTFLPSWTASVVL